jgi:hypothetical protein
MKQPQCEPSLTQMLEDPLTRALMLSDGVDAHALQHLLSEVRQRIAEADTGGPGKPPRSR